MTFYLLLSGDTEEDLIYDTNVFEEKNHLRQFYVNCWFQELLII